MRLGTLLFFLSLLPLRAEDILVSSYGTGDGVTEADVESAIAASSVGDRIILSAGTATWVAVSLPTGRTLRGAGVGLTTISTTTAIATMLTITTDCILEHITFFQHDGLASSGVSSAMVINTGAGQNVIIRYCEVLNVKGRGIYAGSTSSSAHPTGVVHNCTITCDPDLTGSGGTFQLFRVDGGDNNWPNTANPNAGSLKFAPAFGTASAFFIEDCVIVQTAQGDSTVETYYGGKVVFRNNVAQNFELGVHGRDSSLRTGHSFEIYNNVITNNIGASHIGIATMRGGTGVVWGNTITGDHTYGRRITLQAFRNAGNENVDPTARFPYSGQQRDGHDRYDGNTPVTNGTGTHTGANDAAVLTDSTKSWGTDELEGTGTYALGDTLQSYFVWNVTKQVGARIIANTATTATTDRMVYGEIESTNLQSGTYTAFTTPFFALPLIETALLPTVPYDLRLWKLPNDPSTPVNYEIVTVTAIVGKNLTVTRARGGTSALAIAAGWQVSVEGGDRLTWDTGDVYKITDGFPGLDQVGYAGPTTITSTGSTQVLTPIYEWGNSYNGSSAADAVDYSVSYFGRGAQVQPTSEVTIVENREYYDNTPMPGYTPYTYPHPLRGIIHKSAEPRHNRVKGLLTAP